LVYRKAEAGSSENTTRGRRFMHACMVTWDGEAWDIYPVKYHVEKEGDGYVCDCDLFRKEGFCSHAYAVLLKEKGETA